MRIVMLLLALVIIGVIAVKQLNIKPAGQTVQQDAASGAPKVPVRPQDLKAFEQDMNRFVEEAGRQRSREIDEAAK